MCIDVSCEKKDQLTKCQWRRVQQIRVNRSIRDTLTFHNLSKSDLERKVRENNRERLLAAVQDVNVNGQFIRAAGRKHKVPESSIRKYCLRKAKKRGAAIKWILKEVNEEEDVSQINFRVKTAWERLTKKLLKKSLLREKPLTKEVSKKVSRKEMEKEKPVTLTEEERNARLIAAMQDVLVNGEKIRAAGRKYKIPESSIRSRIRQKRKEMDGGDPSRGKKCYKWTTFTPEQEDKLADHCQWLTSVGYTLSSEQVVDMAGNLLQNRRAQYRPPTEKWFYTFFHKRHPELVLTDHTKQVKNVVSKDTLRSYFCELEKLLNKLDVKNFKSNIWWLEETGLNDEGLPCVLGIGFSKSLYSRRQTSPILTMIGAVNGEGEKTPPYFLYKGSQTATDNEEGAPPGTQFTYNTSGWGSSALFLEFLVTHLCEYTTTRPIVLLYDGYVGHYTHETVRSAKEHDIHLFVIPPDCSSRFPNDNNIFRPFKKSLAKLFDYLGKVQFHSTNRQSDFTKIMWSAYEKSMKPKRIEIGFRKSRILPFCNPYE